MTALLLIYFISLLISSIIILCTVFSNDSDNLEWNYIGILSTNILVPTLFLIVITIIVIIDEIETHPTRYYIGGISNFFKRLVNKLKNRIILSHLSKNWEVNEDEEDDKIEQYVENIKIIDILKKKIRIVRLNHY